MLEDAKLVDDDYDDRSGRRSWGTGFLIDDQFYATSLFWQPLQNKEDPFTEVSEAADGILEGADLFCIKPGKAPQFGICVSKEGYKANDNVAAVSLATALTDRSSFVAVFKVKSGWWYVCVRNDIILSDGDMLFLNEEDAKRQFISMLAVPDWGRKIAPDEWNVEDAEELDLSRLLNRGTKAKLQKLKGLRGTKLMVVVAVSAVIGIWLLYSIIDAIFFSAPKKVIIAPVAPKAIRPVEKPPEIKPWEKILDPVEVMKQCNSSVKAFVKILPPGWSLNGITCTTSNASTTWTRQVGRITLVNKALDSSSVKIEGRGVSEDGNTISGAIPFHDVKTIKSPPTMKVQNLKDTLNDMFQAMGGKVSLTELKYTSPEQNVYLSVGFKFNSNNNPVVWLDLLIKFSGLQINSIRYNVENKTWEYEGAIHAL